MKEKSEHQTAPESPTKKKRTTRWGILAVVVLCAIPIIVMWKSKMMMVERNAENAEQREIIRVCFEQGKKAYDAKEFDKAIGFFSEAIEASKAHTESPNLGVAYIRRGNCYAAKGLFDTAIEDYKMAEEVDPEQAHIARSNREKAENAKRTPVKGGLRLLDSFR